MPPNSSTYVFVTVGSTSFDDLVSTVCSQDVLRLLSQAGFDRCVFQIGRGTTIPEEATGAPISIEWYRFKDDITEDIKGATLVIGHGGAGTILDCLSLKKHLISVLNAKLMDNHQSELAEQMAKDGYLVFCKECSALPSKLAEYFSNKTEIREFVSEPDMFPAFLAEFAGMR